ADALAAEVDERTAAVFLQQPNFLGAVEDLEPLAAVAREAGAIVVCACDPIALGILRPPGQLGVDVAVGEGQPLGNRPDFGGRWCGSSRSRSRRRSPGWWSAAGRRGSTRGTRCAATTRSTTTPCWWPSPSSATAATSTAWPTRWGGRWRPSASRRRRGHEEAK